MFAVIAKKAVMVAEAVALWVIKATVLLLVLVVVMVMAVVLEAVGVQDCGARWAGYRVEEPRWLKDITGQSGDTTVREFCQRLEVRE